MKDSLSQAFGKVVRRHRERDGVSQEALADRAEIHRTYVSSVELGKVRLGLDIAHKLAAALGVPLHRLIAEAEAERR